MLVLWDLIHERGNHLEGFPVELLVHLPAGNGDLNLHHALIVHLARSFDKPLFFQLFDNTCQSALVNGDIFGQGIHGFGPLHQGLEGVTLLNRYGAG